MFVKGKSGNPLGRPKKSILFSELAREHSTKALNVLIEALGSDNEKNRIMAANIIIERAWGKPPQEIRGVSQQIIVSATIQKELPGEPEHTNRIAEYFSAPPSSSPA